MQSFTNLEPICNFALQDLASWLGDARENYPLHVLLAQPLQLHFHRKFSKQKLSLALVSKIRHLPAVQKSRTEKLRISTLFILRNFPRKREQGVWTKLARNQAGQSYPTCQKESCNRRCQGEEFIPVKALGSANELKEQEKHT